MLLFLVITFSYSATLKYTVVQTAYKNHEIRSNIFGIDASKQDINVEKSGYYPNLSFDAFVEKSQIKNNRDSAPETPWMKKDGYNAKLSAEQVLYNGGKIDSRVKEKEFTYKSSIFKYHEKNEAVILNIIKTYLDLVKYGELNQVMQYRTEAHDKALEIAYEKEEISGEALETYKTKTLIAVKNDKQFEQQIRIEKAKAAYQNLTKMQDYGTMCRPLLNEIKIPKTLEGMIKLAWENNYKIKEQKEKIRIQKEKIEQSNSNFKPTAKLNLSASYDDDLELAEDGVQKELVGQVRLNWNFYSGGRDSSTKQREKIVLNQELQTLEKIKYDVAEKITALYHQREETKKRIKNFDEDIQTNVEILKITNNQLEDGTKTFIDVLQVKIKLLDAQDNKINQEFVLYQNYYDILKELSILEDSMAIDDQEICKPKIIADLTKDQESNDEDVDNLLDDASAALDGNDTQDDNETLLADDSTDEPQDTLADLVEKAVITNNTDNTDGIQFDKENMKITLPITPDAFTKKSVNPYDKFKYSLDSFSPKLLKVIDENKDQIKSVNIISHTSSEYTKYANVKNSKEAQYQANIKLSYRRAVKTKSYLIKKATKEDLDSDWLSKHIKPVAKGSDDLILDANGVEDKAASRRIAIQIIRK